jgi:hypothetical protein
VYTEEDLDGKANGHIKQKCQKKRVLKRDLYMSRKIAVSL